jgi:hypothetical protein
MVDWRQCAGACGSHWKQHGTADMLLKEIGASEGVLAGEPPSTFRLRLSRRRRQRSPMPGRTGHCQGLRHRDGYPSDIRVGPSRQGRDRDGQSARFSRDDDPAARPVADSDLVAVTCEPKPPGDRGARAAVRSRSCSQSWSQSWSRRVCHGAVVAHQGGQGRGCAGGAGRKQAAHLAGARGAAKMSGAPLSIG